MISDLQNRLFPMGKLPQKPPPPSNHSALLANNLDNKEKSIDLEEDSNKLLSLTKTRPKQNNKRPPSLSFHNKLVIIFFKFYNNEYF